MADSFFDFRERVSQKRKRERQEEPRAGAADQPLTVSQLTSQIERVLKGGLPGTLHVKGEVSNLNLHRASGHLYFTLKDSAACIDCVMFRSDAARLKFMPEDGTELLVAGRIGVYAQRGRYQLYATSLHPLGRGALELAFQQLRRKLESQGLFDAARKKPLPSYPSRIVLVTSRSGAALQDMLKVLRRFPWLRLCLYPVPVQGDGAAELIADAITCLNGRAAADLPGGIDLMLLARGGGSLEDLWEFNEEIVARAIAASRIPIITGIGHEVDVSIADLVADYHAHTPTEAAQVAVASWRAARDLIELSGTRLRRGLRTILQDGRQRLDAIARHELFRRPTDRINQHRQFLDDRQRSLTLAMGNRLRAGTARLTRLEALLLECHPHHAVALKRQRLVQIDARLHAAVRGELVRFAQRIELLDGHLQAISPQQVLRRGYTITMRKKDGGIVRSAREVRTGERLTTQFSDGTVESTVEDRHQLPLFE